MAAASSVAVQTSVYANTDLTDQIKSASRLTIHDPKYSYRVGGVRRKNRLEYSNRNFFIYF